MKIIYAKLGEEIFVDDENFPWLSSRQWEILRGFPQCRIKVDGRRVRFTMHRMILGLEVGDKRTAYPIDGNKLNNQMVNWRIRSDWRKPHKSDVVPGFTGVAFNEKRLNNPYRAFIIADRHRLYVGNYPTPELAYQAHLEASRVNSSFNIDEWMPKIY
jgi:hypothetical protein